MEFTLGIQSTSFIESQNVCIKRILESGNTLLANEKSLYYIASYSTIEEVESLTIYKPLQSKDVNDKPDAINLFAKYLLDHLEQNTVKKI
ncbi:5515_t:CDS:2 [Racocetra persica]|uniref:5515_t:CDS:1 n=1 Tax=Racocetra persica TaxID=160502 RepID=A0ACA9KYH8_9GLOM|nr:5515_t:CDS:2 [Racocetra persica]